MTGRVAVNRQRKRTISIFNLLLILLVIILLAAGYFWYLRYNNLGESPVGNVGFVLKKQPRFLFNIYGNENHPLKAPMAVFVSSAGMIYVANTEGHTVEVFNPNGSYAFSFGGIGAEPGKLSYPYGITQDKNGNILVSESGNARIQVFTPTGRFIRVFADKTNKQLGLQKPGPLYRDNQGNIYIADLGAQKVTVVDEKGNKQKVFTGFQYPHGIAKDSKNRVYISDSGHNRILIFDEMGKRVGSIQEWDQNSPFSMVRGIAINSRDEMFIPDTIASTIRTIGSDFKYEFSFGFQGGEKGNFVYPTGIFIDGKEKIYVADWGNNRIQVWGY